MIIKSAEFSKTVLLTKDLPNDGLAEIVLSGRSNVGKSSFINSIANNYKLARSSKTPGKTVTLNFYLINKNFYLVDAPGYGYAKRAQGEIVNFALFLEKYIRDRTKVSGFIQLIDSRLVTEEDKKMVDFYRAYNIDYFIVLSKIDKLKRNDIKKRIKETANYLGITEEKICEYSSLSGENKEAVLYRLKKILEKEV